MRNQIKVSRDKLTRIITDIDAKLSSAEKPLYMNIIGGAALVLMTDWRKDCGDADYVSSSIPKRVLSDVSVQAGVPPDFFRDDARMFDTSTADWKDIELPIHNFILRSPSMEYMLAMKCESFRHNTISRDPSDIWHIMKDLGISSANEVNQLVVQFFSHEMPTRDRLVISDMISAMNDGDEYSDLMTW